MNGRGSGTHSLEFAFSPRRLVVIRSLNLIEGALPPGVADLQYPVVSTTIRGDEGH